MYSTIAVHSQLSRRNFDSVNITLEEGVQIAEEKYGAKRDDFPASLKYIVAENGSLKLAHCFQLRDTDSNDQKWFQVSVDIHSGTEN
jgi:hypothetical protein